jgi:hypothetical protein
VRLGKAPGRHQPDTDKRWRALLYQGEHFGSEQGGLGHFDLEPPRIEHVLQHLERQLIGLITGWTP